MLVIAMSLAMLMVKMLVMIMMFLASSDPVFQSESMRSPQRSANGTSFWPTSSPTADVVHCAAAIWPFPWPPFPWPPFS